MPKKLPPEWKEFYLRSLQVPVLGPHVLGPMMRGYWKWVQRFHREPAAPPRVMDGLLSTYASTIDALRRQLENLERRTAELESELSRARESARVQQQLACAAVEGLQRRIGRHEQHAAFQRDALAAAVAGLSRREPAANEPAEHLSQGSPRC
ncbi:hypothetical protein H8N03_21880 [Ramlibacter sp. USB13]|uniref:Uncharacterized protein n=1 Tax=Ramlibacter cellulosilyticus TaxID=2764187 RepID=A0A923SD31_9BURK|nr:hypothetical protein [Ramlibacter cellulosilyticus]MBC5785606.1 hypothetical protein [Ramlibacter cellulosilyticus]